MNQNGRQEHRDNAETLIEITPDKNPPLINIGISKENWKRLVVAKGNETKANAWVRSRLHEVSGLSAEVRGIYMRVMIENFFG